MKWKPKDQMVSRSYSVVVLYENRVAIVLEKPEFSRVTEVLDTYSKNYGSDRAKLSGALVTNMVLIPEEPNKSRGGEWQKFGDTYLFVIAGVISAKIEDINGHGNCFQGLAHDLNQKPQYGYFWTLEEAKSWCESQLFTREVEMKWQEYGGQEYEGDWFLLIDGKIVGNVTVNLENIPTPSKPHQAWMPHGEADWFSDVKSAKLWVEERIKSIAVA